MKIIVFDFDKTLTIQDSFNLFIIHLIRRIKPQNLFKKIYLLFILVSLSFLVKLRCCSLLYFKEKMINLLFPLIDDIDYEFNLFVKKLKINNSVDDILKKLSSDKNVKLLIVSASFLRIIKTLYQNITVIGLEYSFCKIKKKYEIFKHPFGECKVSELKKLNINTIDVVYTDSYSDMPLIVASLSAYIVKGSKIYKLK